MSDGNGINRTSGSKRKRDGLSSERTEPRKAIKVNRKSTPAAASHVENVEKNKDAALFLNTAATGKVSVPSDATELNKENIADQIMKRDGAKVPSALRLNQPLTTAHILNMSEKTPLTDFQNQVDNAVTGPKPAGFSAVQRTVSVIG